MPSSRATRGCTTLDRRHADGAAGQAGGDRVRRPVPGIGCGEPDDRQHRPRRWRLHLLVGLRLWSGERARMRQAYVGVVGTSSTRAGVFDETGKLLGLARHPIAIWHEAGDVVEQSSSDIWKACAACVRAPPWRKPRSPRMLSRASASTPPARWSCSSAGSRSRCSGSGVEAETSSSGWTIVRSAEAAPSIAPSTPCCDYVGGAISPEMEAPKLLWLKGHLRASSDAAHFLDLADFLT